MVGQEETAGEGFPHEPNPGSALDLIVDHPPTPIKREMSHRGEMLGEVELTFPSSEENVAEQAVAHEVANNSLVIP